MVNEQSYNNHSKGNNVSKENEDEECHEASAGKMHIIYKEKDMKKVRKVNHLKLK